MVRVPCFVQMADKHLNGVAFCTGVDMCGRKLAHGVRFVGVGSFSDIKLLQLDGGLLRKLFTLVAFEFFGLTFLVQMPVHRRFFTGYLYKTFP